MSQSETDFLICYQYRDHILHPRRLPDGTYVADIYSSGLNIGITLRNDDEQAAVREAAMLVDGILDPWHDTTLDTRVLGR